EEVRGAELARDRRGDEGVRRGDDRAQVLLRDVPLHQLPSLRADDRLHPRAHELGVPAIELLARMARERRELEVEELVDVEAPFLVLAEEVVVLRLVRGAVEHTALDQELRPLVVAVPGQQRVVQVEQRELGLSHPRRVSPASERSASLSSGRGIGRLRCSEYRASASSIAICVPMSRSKCPRRYAINSGSSAMPRPSACARSAAAFSASLKGCSCSTIPEASRERRSARRGSCAGGASALAA